MAVGIIAWTPIAASARLSDSTGEMTPAVHNNNRLRGSIPPSLSLTETEVRPYAYRTDASQTVDYRQFITLPHKNPKKKTRQGWRLFARVFY
ncbi:MAG: hypothetical protein MR787_02420 [Bacteroidales bacterium]|nr:hypothetical protein [Bacteroidales bacterium]